ncbi:MAG: hypothetical protein P4L49_10890 [Desulfosporosinus sp.]|nr:hypothetical protein [Desulfosporosinus sp.]
MFQKGFKALGCAIVPILIFTQSAVAAPLSIIYQSNTNQNVQVNYANALANPPMKEALTSALLAAEVANLPIFITDDNGSVINYTAAIGRSENYSAALNDSTVNQATAPVATQQMNVDGSLTTITSSTSFTYSTTEDLFGNTIVNVTVTAPNVTGVTVKGTAATQVGISNVWRAGLVGSVIVASSDITLVTGNTSTTNVLTSVKATPASVNSVLGGSQPVTLTTQDAYGNPITNQNIYLQTGIQGLWITQVNGTNISGSVNMGTLSAPSMQLVNTPVPLFMGIGASAPAYQSASVAGLIAYQLNANRTPVVGLITGVDGTVSITLADGNVTYVANSASTTITNSYKTDPGTPISQQLLSCFSDLGETQKLGSITVNWGGTVSNTIGALGLAGNNSLLPQCNSLNSVPQVFNFTNNVGDARTIYAAAFDKNGKIIAPAAGNQFDSYGLVFDLTAPDGIYFSALGSTTLPYDLTHKGVKKIKAHYTQSTAGLVPDSFIYEDGTTLTTGFPIITDAYDNYGQINFGLQSDPTTSVNNSGASGSVGITINAFSSSASSINMNDPQGSANGTVSANFTAISAGDSVTIQAIPSSFNAVRGQSQDIILTAEDPYGNPIANQTVYLGTGETGLWITQVNGIAISGSVNMGTSSSTSMQTVFTPVPLFNLGTGTSVPAYQSASAEGLTAYLLNDNTNPVVALTTGTDGSVLIRLVDGNVTYVANTASTSAVNSYTKDPGAALSKTLTLSSDLAGTQNSGSVQVNWN